MPVPASGRRQTILLVDDQKEAARRAGDVGQRLDHPVAQRRGVDAAPADGAGEAEPFGTIVVAVPEEMLGEHHPQPRPRLAGRENHEGDAPHRADEADRADSAPLSYYTLNPRRPRHTPDTPA